MGEDTGIFGAGIFLYADWGAGRPDRLIPCPGGAGGYQESRKEHGQDTGRIEVRTWLTTLAQE